MTTRNVRKVAEKPKPQKKYRRCFPRAEKEALVIGFSESEMQLRFHSKCQPVESGCILWIGTKSNGYGMLYLGRDYIGNSIMAHRAAWIRKHGPIPEGLVIDHLCRQPACVNTEHMEPVSNAVNVLRGIGPSARHAAKTECLNGHAFTAQSTYLYKGHRLCRICNNNRTRLRVENNREEFNRKRREKDRLRIAMKEKTKC